MDEYNPRNALAALTPGDAVYAAVGRIALYWTYVEYLVEVLIWRYVGDVDIGHILTSKLSNPDRAEVLDILSKHEESDPAGRNRIEHAIKGFKILRVNRNKIIHSYNFFTQPGSGIRFSGRKKVRVMEAFDEYLVTVDQLNQLVSGLIAWGDFLQKIINAVTDRRGLDPDNEPIEWRAWPDRPRLPEKLTPLPAGTRDK